ncbi:copper resistance protein CopC [Sphingomonas sp.]|uniref:copper resistance CopC family protein n=1 Tax=Sphingomonas sp. TaxID=28214 RepID=UPI0035AEF6A9
MIQPKRIAGFIPRRPVALWLAGGTLFGFTPAPSLAHDLVRRSVPAADSVVAPGPAAIRIEFSGRVDRPLSELVLRGPQGEQRVLDLVRDVPTNALAAAPVELRPGEYLIRWTAMSSDGHLTRGDIRFRCAPP